MPNTYSQIHIQFVFAVKHRTGLIQGSWRDELYKYITGIVQNNKHKMLAIGGTADHIHMLIGLRPAQSVADIMQEVKAYSSKWINEKGFLKSRFEWQEGYGAFSYGASQVDSVIKYILIRKNIIVKKHL